MSVEFLRRNKEHLKQIMMFSLATMTFLMSLLGFQYALFFSVVVLGLTIYDYDLPWLVFGQDSLHIIGRQRSKLRIMIALSCMFVVLEGNRALDLIAYVLPSKWAEGLHPADVAIYTLEALVLICGSVTLTFLLLRAYVSRKIPNLGLEQEQLYNSATLLFLFLTLFLSLGSDFFVNLAIYVILILWLVYRYVVVKKKPSEGLYHAFVGAVETRAKMKKGLFLTLLLAIRDLRKMVLAAVLFVGSPVFMFNMRLFDLHDTWQLIFMVLSVLPIVFAFLAIRKEQIGRCLSVFGFALFIPAFIVAIRNPMAVPAYWIFYGTEFTRFFTIRLIVFVYWATVVLYFWIRASFAERSHKLKEYKRWYSKAEIGLLFGSIVIVYLSYPMIFPSERSPIFFTATQMEVWLPPAFLILEIIKESRVKKITRNVPTHEARAHAPEIFGLAPSLKNALVGSIYGLFLWIITYEILTRRPPLIAVTWLAVIGFFAVHMSLGEISKAPKTFALKTGLIVGMSLILFDTLWSLFKDWLFEGVPFPKIMFPVHQRMYPYLTGLYSYLGDHIGAASILAIPLIFISCIIVGGLFRSLIEKDRLKRIFRIHRTNVNMLIGTLCSLTLWVLSSRTYIMYSLTSANIVWRAIWVMILGFIAGHAALRNITERHTASAIKTGAIIGMNIILFTVLLNLHPFGFEYPEFLLDTFLSYFGEITSVYSLTLPVYGLAFSIATAQIIATASFFFCFVVGSGISGLAKRKSLAKYLKFPP